MSTPAQIAANRENAQLSTGPQTPEGKHKVSLNARRHGAAAKQVILLEGEDDEYHQLRESLHKSLKPHDPNQEHLFEQILVSMWNMRRCRLNEIELQQQTPDLNDPMLVEGLEKRLHLILLYHQRAERTYFKCLHELRLLQTEAQYRLESYETDEDEPTIHGNSPLIDFRNLLPAIGREAAVQARTDSHRKNAAVAAYLNSRLPSERLRERTNPIPRQSAA